MPDSVGDAQMKKENSFSSFCFCCSTRPTTGRCRNKLSSSTHTDCTQPCQGHLSCTFFQTHTHTHTHTHSHLSDLLKSATITPRQHKHNSTFHVKRERQWKKPLLSKRQKTYFNKVRSRRATQQLQNKPPGYPFILNTHIQYSLFIQRLYYQTDISEVCERKIFLSHI